METVLKDVKIGKKTNVVPIVNNPKTLKQRKLFEQTGEFKETKNKLTPNQIAGKNLETNLVVNNEAPRRNKDNKMYDVYLIDQGEIRDVRDDLERSDHLRYLNMPVLAKVLEYRYKSDQGLKGTQDLDPDEANQYITGAIVNVTTKKGDSKDHKKQVKNDITDLQLANMTAEFIRYNRFLIRTNRQLRIDNNEFRHRDYIMAESKDTVEADIVA